MDALTIYYDPFGIMESTGMIVSDARTEKDAFLLIDNLFSSNADESAHHEIIVRGLSCNHFESYRARLRGIRTVDITPRSVLRERFASSPPFPEWLTDELIHKSNLLSMIPPGTTACTDWATAIASRFFPGLDEDVGLAEWLLIAAKSIGFPYALSSSPIMEHVVGQFRDICSRSLSSQEVNERLIGDLSASSSPSEFAITWLRRTALWPLLLGPGASPLGGSIVELGVLQDPIALFIAGQLPLVFPLPGALHQEISLLFVSAIRTARLKRKESLERTAMSINAWWDGIDEELQTWLTLSPRSMTAKVARHLGAIPGFEGNRVAAQLVEYYRPPKPVPEWNGLDDGFDVWVERYAEFIRSAFFRRSLPSEQEDPANGFARWIKDNYTVSFEHPERGYSTLARRAQEAIANGRTVIIVMVDALGIQVSRDMIGYMNDELGATPTSATYAFAPIPTVTEVCKQAILTGAHPDASGKDLQAALGQAYGLAPAQIVLAANWRDAERVKINQGHRLIVYRDNRLDDRLSSVACFRELLDECANIFPRLARTVSRWTRDLTHLLGQEPLVLLCADHGFTFCPTPASLGNSPQPVSVQRCVVAESRDQYKADISATYIDKNIFHLKLDYAAALSRFRGTDTVSGWHFAHGGLLPEEVLIPIVEWHGDVRATPWPQIVLPSSTVLSNGGWVLSVLIDNPTNVPIGKAKLCIVRTGHAGTTQTDIPAIRPHSSFRTNVHVPDPEPCRDNKVSFEVTLTLHPLDAEPISRSEQFLVAREKQLVEKTKEQQAFEDMF